MKSYAGNITNKGSQYVKAVFAQTPPKEANIKTGSDLRCGKPKRKA